MDGNDTANDEVAAAEMVVYAMEQGVNYYDTTWGYHEGNSETVMGGAACKIPQRILLLGGDLFSIEVAEPYSSDYDETDAQANREQQEDARPALAAQVDNLEDYSIVFLGFSNWYYDMPMAVYSFLEGHDLAGKTIIPFCTSGGGSFSNSLSTIAELQPNAEVVQDGLALMHNSSLLNSQDDVNEWLAELDGLWND